jgi:uncharacterized iron-regulated membrane protein
MTTTTVFQGGPDALPVTGDALDTDADAAARAKKANASWRSIWRLHFYAGIFVAPMLVLMAVTGLIILYTQPILEWSDGSLLKVADTGQTVGLQQQEQAVQAAFPSFTISAVNTGRDGTIANTFVVTSADGETIREVFVNPHTGQVTGSKRQGSDLVGLANRLHGQLNNDGRTQKMPSLDGIFFGGKEKFVDVPVGDMLLEILACWTLALAATGLYLWWPRKNQPGKALLKPRLGRLGRARWRDLHAISGALLSVIVIFFILTGLPWSAFWGENWRTIASHATPNSEGEAPSSTVARPGDLDRLGQRIPWVAAGIEVPASNAGAAAADPSAPLPATISMDVIAKAAQEQGLQPGYLIAIPVNEKADDGTTTYGSFVLTNYWPGRVQNEQTIYLDQFSGKTLEALPADHYGALPWTISAGIQTHMGAQLGVANRVVMTTACLLTLFSVFSAFMMWWKRRPRGGTGFPRRPVDAKLQRNVAIIAVVLALFFPLWGLSVLAVLAFDRFVIRRITPLRRAFGMRDRPATTTP